MSSEGLFQENIERWSRSFPEQAKQISSLKCENCAFKTNEDGTLNLIVRVEGKEFLCHAERDPEGEARGWVSKIKVGNCHVLLVWGVGLGYIYDALLSWLKQDQKRALVFVEPNPEVIHRLFETERGKRILFDKQVWLYQCDAKGSQIDDIVQAFIDKRCYMAVLPAYSQFLNEDVKCFQSRFSYFFGMRSSINSEHKFMGSAFFRNFFKDLFLLPQSKFAEKMKGSFAGVPAIIVGAGPSLAKQLPLLKKLQNKALIFAGGTAVNALDTANIIPHFGVGLDPNPTHFTRLIMNRAYETPFFYKNRMNYEALNIIHGDRIFLNGCSGYPIATWLENELGVEGEINDEGFNVINLAVSVAKFLGCNPIICIGLDLAYTDGQSYPPGILMHPLHSRKDHLRTKSADDELVVKTDIYGKSTVTLWKWISESYWYTEFVQKNPEIRLVNCTEGGIGLGQVPNIPFKEVVHGILTKDFDFETWISGVVENATMPNTLNGGKVRELLVHLQDKLKRFSEVCTIVIKDCQAIFKDIKAGIKVPQMLLSKDVIQLLAEFETEPVITELIRTHRENFLDATKEQRQRIELNSAFVTKEESLLKKVAQNNSMYDYLKITANNIAQFVQEAVERYDALPDDFNAYSNETGKSPKKILSGLQLKSTNTAATVDEMKYRNGALMFRQYHVNGVLEGPSTSYSSEGELLAWAHFENGLKEGPTYTFFHEGSLKKLNHYSRGELDGKQICYYPNGQVKSEVSYINGLLDGDVLLYYPNGNLKRELHFKNGLRDGFERIWNKNGLLTVEAHFQENLPFGTSRMWYEDGNIAIETIYKKAGEDPIIRFWDTKGSLISSDMIAKDYFQVVGQRTGVLTDTILNVVEQVKALAPLVENRPSNTNENVKASEAKEMQKDLNEVMEALSAFQKVSKLVETTYGSDQGNEQEIIWKTPIARKILESQVEGMAKALSDDFNKVQSALKETIENLAENSKKSNKEIKGNSKNEPPNNV